jgi:outer membrane protein insertion porin family
MAFYYDRGYVNVAVTPPVTSATVTFDIKEGDQFRVGKLSIKDAKPADAKKWLAALGVKKGDVFSRSAMTAGMQKLKDATAAVDIDPITNIDTAKKTIDVVFEIQKSVSPSSK